MEHYQTACVNMSKQDVEIARLVAENERLTAEVAEYLEINKCLRDSIIEWENREAVVCPEDVSFEEVIARLNAENERLTAEDMCDACAGTGKPASGVPCMCGGTGKMSDAARWLRGENAKAMAKLAGATFNCPSCGRHDFGLWQGAAQLKDEVDRLTAEVERLTVSGKEELARLHSHDPARVERAASNKIIVLGRGEVSVGGAHEEGSSVTNEVVFMRLDNPRPLDTDCMDIVTGPVTTDDPRLLMRIVIEDVEGARVVIRAFERVIASILAAADNKEG